MEPNEGEVGRNSSEVLKKQSEQSQRLKAFKALKKDLLEFWLLVKSLQTFAQTNGCEPPLQNDALHIKELSVYSGVSCPVYSTHGGS